VNDKKGFLLALIFTFGLAAFMMLRPFTSFLLGAVILAFILHKPHKHLKKYTGEKISAFILTISSILLAIIPLLIIGAAVVDDAQGVVKGVNTTDVIDFDMIELQIEELTGTEIDIQSKITSGLSSITSGAYGGLSRAINLAAGLTLGLSLTLFLLYYLIKDGVQFVGWIKDVSPLPEEIEDNLLDEMPSSKDICLLP
jgi:predicted PurR-regulated permease PerM